MRGEGWCFLALWPILFQTIKQSPGEWFKICVVRLGKYTLREWRIPRELWLKCYYSIALQGFVNISQHSKFYGNNMMIQYLLPELSVHPLKENGMTRLYKKALCIVATERALGQGLWPCKIYFVVQSPSCVQLWDPICFLVGEVGGGARGSRWRPAGFRGPHPLSLGLIPDGMVAWNITLLHAKARCSSRIPHPMGPITSSDKLFTVPTFLSSHEIHRQYHPYLSPPQNGSLL